VKSKKLKMIVKSVGKTEVNCFFCEGTGQITNRDCENCKGTGKTMVPTIDVRIK
jgi:DnaJ-class molecular chaperone